ncbi:zinc ABC transporter substrate-binding protein ZnuA [Azospirillum halopraeferens]|uniref:zinc ABC transporter substrate-binding protein ZnuA n=1 Tax=Azospirillum halopraeferens TaxID=34010 RepID=UPI00040AF865|nr:zinc ABC transporter substrate-binding protein ZnuA [Azospirillum halopraeferens]
MRPLLVSSLAALLLTTAPVLADAPRVVASVKPLHSLVSSVMQGVGEPGLVVRGGASPHTYNLRPSDARALEQAQVVFWFGEGLEGFLEKPLSGLAGKARVVELMDAPGVTLLEAREGGAWESHDHGHGHSHGHSHKGHSHARDHKAGDHDHDAMNAHLWLDPANARAMVAVIAGTLAEADPANAAAYRANAEATTARLDALDAELAALLAPVKDKPFVVFHDAYPYLEARYGLSAVGAITVNPEQRPSAKRLKEIRTRISGLGPVCVFSEPQFEPKLVATIVEGTGARTGVLDPLGADIAAGPDLYPTLLRNLAASLAGCLKG